MKNIPIESSTGNAPASISKTFQSPLDFVDTGIPVYIRSQLGSYLAVQGGNVSNGAKLTTLEAPLTQASVKWTIERASADTFFISSMVNTTFVVHQSGGSNDNGGECTTWNMVTDGQQTW